jgi:hypothetical protein
MPQILRDAKTIREFWGKNGVLGFWHKIPQFLLTYKKFLTKIVGKQEGRHVTRGDTSCMPLIYMIRVISPA